MVVHNRTVERKQVHPLVRVGMLQVRRVKELEHRLQTQQHPIELEFRHLLRNRELEDVPLLIGTLGMIAAVELVSN
jgi:hypothetical protein